MYNMYFLLLNTHLVGLHYYFLLLFIRLKQKINKFYLTAS